MPPVRRLAAILAADVTGKTVILVDDGLATGATMRAAVQALKQQRSEAHRLGPDRFSRYQRRAQGGSR